jgi:hypothetical protein
MRSAPCRVCAACGLQVRRGRAALKELSLPMLPTGGALVLASTACAQIALEPPVRVPAVTPAGYGRPSHACAVVLGIRHRCWAS